WNGALPTRKELGELRTGFQREFRLPPPVTKVLHELPRAADPMRVLQLGMAALGIHDPDRDDNSPEANRRKALRITPELSARTCAFHRIRTGKEPIETSSEPTFAGNFFFHLHGRKPKDIEEEAVDQA